MRRQIINYYISVDTIYEYTGIFCDGTLRYAVPEVLARKDSSLNVVSETLPPGIGITNPIPLRPNFGSLRTFRSTFFLDSSPLCVHILPPPPPHTHTHAFPLSFGFCMVVAGQLILYTVLLTKQHYLLYITS
jgi:hypothetical protein